MILKKKVYQECINVLENKIRDFKKVLSDLTEDAENDNKSTVGDKHETARAMMQMEYDKIANQLSEAENQLDLLHKIDINIKHVTVGLGSLLKTDKALLFLSVPLGKITVDGLEVFILSPQSPLGKKMIGLKINDKVELNGNYYSIEETV